MEKNQSISKICSGEFKEIIFSPTGGTKKVADIISQRIASDEPVQVMDLCDAKASYLDTEITEDDIVIIAVPSYGGRVPGTAVERILQIQGNGAKAILVCVYGNRAYDNTLMELFDVANKSSFHVIAAVAAIAEHSMARQLAAGRPDDADVQCLQDMADKICEKIMNEDEHIPIVPGTIPEKSSANFSMAPGKTNACIKCGLCAKECPVGAIDPDTMEADKKKCISCMRCISVCPQNARKLNVVITSLGGVALGVLCKKRKECELYL